MDNLNTNFIIYFQDLKPASPDKFYLEGNANEEAIKLIQADIHIE